MQELPEALQKLILSFLTAPDILKSVSCSKELCWQHRRRRLGFELRAVRQWCFHCHDSPVLGIFLDKEFVRTSAFCAKHLERTRGCVSLTQSMGGKNASFARLTVIYWQNQHHSNYNGMPANLLI